MWTRYRCQLQRRGRIFNDHGWLNTVTFHQFHCLSKTLESTLVRQKPSLSQIECQWELVRWLLQWVSPMPLLQLAKTKDYQKRDIMIMELCWVRYWRTQRKQQIYWCTRRCFEYCIKQLMQGSEGGVSRHKYLITLPDIDLTHFQFVLSITRSVKSSILTWLSTSLLRFWDEVLRPNVPYNFYAAQSGGIASLLPPPRYLLNDVDAITGPKKHPPNTTVIHPLPPQKLFFMALSRIKTWCFAWTLVSIIFQCRKYHGY